MGVGLPKVLYSAELLGGSGLCGMGKTSPTTATVTTAYQTTINGHATQISTVLTQTGTTTSAPSHTESSLGSIGVGREHFAAPLMTAFLAVVFFTLGGVRAWW